MGDGWETARKITRPAILEAGDGGLIKVCRWDDPAAWSFDSSQPARPVWGLRAWSVGVMWCQVPGSDWAVLKLGTPGTIQVRSSSHSGDRASARPWPTDVLCGVVMAGAGGGHVPLQGQLPRELPGRHASHTYPLTLIPPTYMLDR